MIELRSPRRKALLSPLAAQQVCEFPVKAPSSGAYYTVKGAKVASTTHGYNTAGQRGTETSPQPAELAHRWRFIKQEVFDSKFSTPSELRNLDLTLTARPSSVSLSSIDQQPRKWSCGAPELSSRRPSRTSVVERLNRRAPGPVSHCRTSYTARGLLERALGDDEDAELPPITQLGGTVEPATRVTSAGRPPSRSSLSASSSTMVTDTRHPDTASSSNRTAWPALSVTHNEESRITSAPNTLDERGSKLEMRARTPTRVGLGDAEYTPGDESSGQSPELGGKKGGLVSPTPFTDQAQRLRVTLLTSAYQKMVDDLVEMHGYEPNEREAIYRHVSIFRELPLQSRYHEMHPLVNMRLAKIDVCPRQQQQQQQQRKYSFAAVETRRDKAGRLGSRGGRRGSAWHRPASVLQGGFGLERGGL